MTLPTGGTVTNIFDEAGRLIETRDGTTNLISRTEYDPDSGLVAAEVDKFGTNKFGYDSAGNLALFTNSLGQIVGSGFDANGQISSMTNNGIVSTFAYDALGRDATADYGHGITVTNTYQTDQDWTSVHGSTIGHIERRLDDQNRLSGWTTANGATPGFSYDENGVMEYETNSLGVVTKYVYDLVRRVSATTNVATGAGTTYAYDLAGQRIGVTNALGQWTRSGFHEDGSLAATTNALGRYWLYTNSTAGSCCGSTANTTVTDPLSRQAVNNVSDLGLPLETIRIAGANSRTNKTTYLAGMTDPDEDAAEYPETITDEGGHVRRFAYTDLGILERATDLSGNTWWTNQYDLDTGALTNVLSPTGESLSYNYDDLDNLKTIRFGDGHFLTNNYNPDDNRLSSANLPSGATVTNLYDEAGRLTNRFSTIGENASFEYNLNDAVTSMTDNTGATTNLYDSAGRLYGIDYPSGGSVRYGLDLLDRITNVTVKASAGGSSYSTKYTYDAVGNVTNINDPLNGNTLFEYDEVNRKRKRTLPNGVVTTYDYNEWDQITNMTHKLGTNLVASFVYERAQGGEPTKITREDGTWVAVGYDSALRLTNEVYYSAGGVPQTTNSYGYDASGNRLRLTQGSQTLTNGISPGYQVTQVKNANSGSVVETYDYDNGGRVTNLVRSGITMKLGYNTADQLTAVTNSTASTWATYVHDAEGRRTISTNSAGTVRRFLVAHTPETDLESPLLVANASAGIQAGYVYLGYQPQMRFDAAGNPVYYLEDGMGSVAALADSTGAKIASFNYDGFGNFCTFSGSTNAPSGVGGDFRFQGCWFEEGSGLYNMRAREYDPRLGRFTSRDPIIGDVKVPNSLQPYVFANQNCYLYTDRRGEFTMIELSMTASMENYFQAFKTAAVNEAKRRLKDELINAISSQVTKQLLNLLPGGDFAKMGAGFKGASFGEIIAKGFCDLVGGDMLPEGITLEAGVSERGEPRDNGLDCESMLRGDLPSIRPGTRRPDFIIGPKPHSRAGNHPMTYLIGEVKYRPITLYSDYVLNRKNKAGQFDAIRYYSAKHTFSHIAVFVTLKRDPTLYKQLRATIGAKCAEAGCIGVLVTDLHVKKRR